MNTENIINEIENNIEEVIPTMENVDIPEAIETCARTVKIDWKKFTKYGSICVGALILYAKRKSIANYFEQSSIKRLEKKGYIITKPVEDTPVEVDDYECEVEELENDN